MDLPVLPVSCVIVVSISTCVTQFFLSSQSCIVVVVFNKEFKPQNVEYVVNVSDDVQPVFSQNLLYQEMLKI